MASIEANLKDPGFRDSYYNNVFITYKLKAKKVWPVNVNNKTYKTLKERQD
jgi:hypothetical protein